MKEIIIDKLIPILKENISSIKDISKDSSNNKYMSDSDIQIIDFDKVAEIYADNLNILIKKSNDGLYIDDNVSYFIEFKNGKLNQNDIHTKIYESVIMISDLGVSSIENMRKNMIYILVYNPKNFKVPPTPCAQKIHKHNLEIAKRKRNILNLNRFENFIFKESFGCTMEEFANDYVPYFSELESR